MSDNKFKRTEKYLYNYKYIDTLNELTDIKIKRLKDNVTIKAVTFEEKISSNSFHSSVESEVIRREDEIQEIIDNLLKEKQARINEKELINKVLDLLSPEERKLIELRYFNKDRTSWTNVAMKLNISIDSCIRLRRKIINKISEWIN